MEITTALDSTAINWRLTGSTLDGGPARGSGKALEIKVFGKLAVSEDGRPVVITRAKCQAVLALLIAHAPHGISIDGMTRALWTDASEQNGRNSVRVHIRYLRQSLSDQPGAIGLVAGRYTLTLPRTAIDVFRFEDHALAARAAAARGEPSQACSSYEAAIQEWTGAPYAEFRDLDPLRDEFTRLDVFCLDVMEGYATALLDDDRAADACRSIEPMMGAHLIRETLAARLMLAMYRTGRQEDALTLFGRVKSALRDGLGLVPSAALQGLADAIVLQRPELEISGSPPSRDRVALRSRHRTEFVGRTGELRQLLDAWDRTVSGTPQLAHISGTTGIGKSALASQFVDAIRATDALVVRGRCEPDPAENFEPFPALLRTVFEHTPPTDTGPSVLGELGRLLPDLADGLPRPTPPAEPGAGRQRLFTAVGTMLAMPARPRLIVIEDLHWARPDALLLLRHVLRAARGQLMILVTHRARTPHRPSILDDALASGRLAHPDVRIFLDRMNRHEVAAIIDSIAPVEQRSNWLDQLDELVDVSDGNPLALREVLRQLELAPDANISEIAPEDIAARVARRLRRFDQPTLSLIRLASVFGREFTLAHLAAAAAVSPEAALDAVEQAIESGVVVELESIDRFAFANPLFRNVLHQGLTSSRRARSHLACATVLSREFDAHAVEGRWAEVARHLVAARPVSDADETARAARRAGHDAAERYAHQEAAVWFEQALVNALAGDWESQQIGQLRLEYGSALENSGDLDGARVQYFLTADIARAHDDRLLLAAAVVAATPPEAVLDPVYGAVLADLATEALAGLEPADGGRIPLLRSLVMAVAYFDPNAVDRLAREANLLTVASDDPEAQSSMLEIRYISNILHGNLAGRLAVSREIRRHTDAHRLLRHAGTASRHLLVELLVNGALDEFDAELELMIRTASETSIPADLYWSNAFRATRSLMRNASELSEELVRGAALIGKQLQITTSDGVHMLQTFTLRYQQGRTREITSGLQAPERSAPQVLAGTALLAISCAEAGRLETASALLDHAVADGTVNLQHDNFFLAAAGLFGGVAARCGSTKQRDALRTVLEPHADSFCVFGAGGAVFGTHHHWLSRLAAAAGDLEQARGHLERAAELCDTAGATYWADRARHEASELAHSDRRITTKETPNHADVNATSAGSRESVE